MADKTEGAYNGANGRQVGGSHYKTGGEEHWDRAWRLKYDPFQYIITKWVERWRKKGGIEDLEKALHALTKYIEVVKAELAGGPGPGYVDQDRTAKAVDAQPKDPRAER